MATFTPLQKEEKEGKKEEIKQFFESLYLIQNSQAVKKVCSPKIAW